ncbi:MAG: hypothetical protein IKE65_02935 [Clostridia bacterium]|nr:hypothetical protein [Clostridia bacterium]
MAIKISAPAVMKTLVAAMVLVCTLCFLLTACSANQKSAEQTAPSAQGQPSSAAAQSQQSEPHTQDAVSQSAQENTSLQMAIDGTPVAVEWEDNAAVAALGEAVKENALSIRMTAYGGFEQVGSLNKSLPAEDAQMTTSPGDIVLYEGNRVVVFYGSNTWAYTRLGHITDKTQAQLEQLLSGENTTVTLTF